MNGLNIILEALYPSSLLPDRFDRERARMIYAISTFMLVAFGFLNAGSTNTGENLWQVVTGNPTARLPLVFLLFLLAVTYGLTRAGRLNIAALSLILTWVVGFGLGLAASGFQMVTSSLVLALTLLLAVLLLRWTGLVLGTGLALATLVFGLGQRLEVLTTTSSQLMLGSTLLLLVAVMMGFYLWIYEKKQNVESADAVQTRRKVAEITQKINLVVSSRHGLKETLLQVVNNIVAEYPTIYHAQIFLVDETGQTAHLRASTGKVGQQLLSMRFSVDVDTRTVVGRAMANREPSLQQIEQAEIAYQVNPYLPGTRVEAAFPLIVDDKVIGALDLQSEWLEAFPDHSLEIFETLASHTAFSLETARLFDEVNAQKEANVRLNEQSQEALSQVEELNRRLTGQAWSAYLSDRQMHLGVDIDLDQQRVEYGEDWTPDLRLAAQENQLLERQADGHRTVAVPVRVHGEVIGAMEFELDGDDALTADDRQLIEEVSERFGLTAENARLFEESRRIAQREAMINEVGSRLQASSGVETTLIEAARSLQTLLKANRVSIQLGEPPVTQAVENGKGGAV